MPATQDGLCMFVARMAKEGLKYRTLKGYLAGVKHLHVAEGLPEPFGPAQKRLHYALQGIRRREANLGQGERPRLPITPELLKKLKGVWSKKKGDPDIVMVWAACCLAFFGFLRVGEFTVPGDAGYEPTVHLSRTDIHVDATRQPHTLRVDIKQSKTDPFRKGISLFLGSTGKGLCPVEAMQGYLRGRGRTEGPLFRYKDGRPLTRQRFIRTVRRGLTVAKVPVEGYSSHSFRIGAATAAAAEGVSDAVIKTLGRWKSSAYNLYVKIPRNELAEYSKTLAG